MSRLFSSGYVDESGPRGGVPCWHGLEPWVWVRFSVFPWDELRRREAVEALIPRFGCKQLPCGKEKD